MARILWLNWSGGGRPRVDRARARARVRRPARNGSARQDRRLPCNRDHASLRAGRSLSARAAAHPLRLLSPRRLSRSRIKTSSPPRSRACWTSRNRAAAPTLGVSASPESACSFRCAWLGDPGRYLAKSSSAAVMMPVSGWAAQYSPSFLALAMNFSVSITGGSSSPR
jgi:hypothetical protein